MHEKREQLLPVGKPAPADGAVAIGGHDEPSIAADVHAPGDAGDCFAPKLAAVRAESAQPVLGAKDEA